MKSLDFSSENFWFETVAGTREKFMKSVVY